MYQQVTIWPAIEELAALCTDHQAAALEVLDVSRNRRLRNSQILHNAADAVASEPLLRIDIAIATLLENAQKYLHSKRVSEQLERSADGAYELFFLHIMNS